MNSRRSLYAQSIRGPIILITIGVLFALQQAHILSFGRSWPLLIIIIGVMKLLERAWTPVNPWQPPTGSYRNPGAYPTGAYAQPQYPQYQTPPPPPPPANPAEPPPSGGNPQ